MHDIFKSLKKIPMRKTDFYALDDVWNNNFMLYALRPICLTPCDLLVCGIPDRGMLKNVQRQEDSK